MIANYADHSANERTFLAWVRTVMAVVGFGLAAARISSSDAATWSEVLLLGTGGLVVGVAFLRMRKLQARIDAAATMDDGALPTDALLLLLVATLFALLAVFALHVGKGFPPGGPLAAAFHAGGSAGDVRGELVCWRHSAPLAGVRP